MCSNNFGCIINIGFIYLVVVFFFKLVYVVVKYGLLGFFKIIVLEIGDCDVIINIVCFVYVKMLLVEK